MADLISSLLTYFWYNHRERKRVQREDARQLSAMDAFLAKNGFVSLDIQEKVLDMSCYDTAAMLDRVLGTLDRDTEEWQREYRKYNLQYHEETIDGYRYLQTECLANRYCMKLYGKKFLPGTVDLETILKGGTL